MMWSIFLCRIKSRFSLPGSRVALTRPTMTRDLDPHPGVQRPSYNCAGSRFQCQVYHSIVKGCDCHGVSSIVKKDEYLRKSAGDGGVGGGGGGSCLDSKHRDTNTGDSEIFILKENGFNEDADDDAEFPLNRNYNKYNAVECPECLAEGHPVHSVELGQSIAWTAQRVELGQSFARMAEMTSEVVVFIAVLTTSCGCRTSDVTLLLCPGLGFGTGTRRMRTVSALSFVHPNRGQKWWPDNYVCKRTDCLEIESNATSQWVSQWVSRWVSQSVSK